jgi:hypothetical protein
MTIFRKPLDKLFQTKTSQQVSSTLFVLTSHKNLLRNHWANCNQTLVVWSLDGHLPKLCPMIPTSNQARRFLWEFPIGSYVKLSSAVAAILVGGLKCRTQIWKGTTQGSFQQSLVEIGSVDTEKIFFKFHPPFF